MQSAPDHQAVRAVPQPSIEAGRNNNFNFLRLALAVIVMYGHSFAAANGNFRGDLYFFLTRGREFSGGLAVDFFFAISGFLIAQSWLRSAGAWSYFKKRILRIGPGYLAAMLISVFVVGPIAAESVSAYFHALRYGVLLREIVTLDTTLIKAFPHQAIHEINGSLWTIQSEFVCYIATAVLGIAGFYRKRGLTLALFVGAMTFYLLSQRFGWQFSHDAEMPYGGRANTWARLATFYLAGICFHFYKDKITYSAGGFFLALGITLIGGWVGGLLFVLPTAGVYALFCFAFAPEIPLQRFGRNVDLSYGVYLYSCPAQQLLLRFGIAHTPYSLLALSLPLTFLCAAASWHLVERPFLKMKPRS